MYRCRVAVRTSSAGPRPEKRYGSVSLLQPVSVRDRPRQNDSASLFELPLRFSLYPCFVADKRASRLQTTPPPQAIFRGRLVHRLRPLALVSIISRQLVAVQLRTPLGAHSFNSDATFLKFFERFGEQTVLMPRERSPERIVEQIVVVPVPRIQNIL